MIEEQPPEGRLDEEARARIRAGLMAATEERGNERRWLAPVAAAAAVAVLLGGAAVVGIALADGGDGRGTAPAGQGTTSGETATDEPSVSPSPGTTASLPEPTDGPKGQASCDRVVQGYLPGATKAAEAPYGDGFVTYLYATSDQWVVCDTFATIDGGPPTVTTVEAFGPAPPSKDLFLISTNLSLNAADGGQFFAAGAPIPGVTAITYRFPTGDVVDATITDGIWVMQYLMPHPPNRIWTDPVLVVATLDDGSKKEYFLTEMDLCAQINHGC